MHSDNSSSQRKTDTTFPRMINDAIIYRIESSFFPKSRSVVSESGIPFNAGPFWHIANHIPFAQKGVTDNLILPESGISLYETVMLAKNFISRPEIDGLFCSDDPTRMDILFGYPDIEHIGFDLLGMLPEVIAFGNKYSGHHLKIFMLDVEHCLVGHSGMQCTFSPNRVREKIEIDLKNETDIQKQIVSSAAIHTLEAMERTNQELYELYLSRSMDNPAGTSLHSGHRQSASVQSLQPKAAG